MKKSGWTASLLTLLLSGQLARAEERIHSFDSTITVRTDGTLDVRESIRVNAEHRAINRGIFREFPTIYRAADGRDIVVGFRFDKATRDGAPEQWRVESRSNGVRIYLGNPDRKVAVGEHTYEIVYHTDRQMGFFAEHDELYWNVTGNGWDFPIDHATARVILPESIPRDQIRMEAYTGPMGSRGRAYTAAIVDQSPIYSTTQPLGRREGLTIVAMWPKGFISQAVEAELPRDPAGAQDRTLASSENPGAPASAAHVETLPGRQKAPFPWPLLIAAIGFAWVNYRYYLEWKRVGRDPPARTIIPEYEPPAGMSPAAMRYLLEWKTDDTGFTASVLSLAVNGHLRIDESKGVLGFGKTYTLTKLKDANAKEASADERALLEGLFRVNDSVELHKGNRRAINRAINAHGHVLYRRYSKGYFSFNHDDLLYGILRTGLVLSLTFLCPVVLAIDADWYFGTLQGWLTDGIVAATFVSNFIWAKLLKAPTNKGAELAARILGFKQYLQVTEGEALENVTKPPPPLTQQLYETYLPAALALGVAHKWAERFVDVFNMKDPHYSPGWYGGSHVHGGNVAGFASSLGSSLSGAISSATVAPGSSSGGSGGSSGGGSSGGGGGGGGGGGW